LSLGICDKSEIEPGNINIIEKGVHLINEISRIATSARLPFLHAPRKRGHRRTVGEGGRAWRSSASNLP